MFRITTSTSEFKRVLKLEGKLLHPWIDELVQEYRSARANGNSVELDMKGVSFIDSQCLVVLSDLIRQGMVISARSPFVSELLKESKS